MADNITRIAVAVDGRQIKTAKTELVGMQAAGMSAQKSMVALGAAVVGVGAAAIGMSAGVKVLANYDTSLRGLRAVSGATAKQMKALEEQSRSLGATTAFSAAEAADAQRFLAMAGLEVNEVLGATPSILELAVAGQIDLARAADLASNVLGGFRLEVDDLNRVNNVLAATASKSNTSVEQLGSALSFAAPIAAAAGISIEETAAAIGSLGDAGLQGTRAGTGFLGIIRQLSLITPKAEAALSKYGIATDQVDVETRGLTAVLDTLRDANLSAADAIQIFGSEAGPAGQILANSADRVREFTTELENSEGAISAMAEIMGQGLAMAFKEFQSAAQEAVLVVGRDLGAGGELEGAVRSATDVVRALGENMDTVADVATGLAIIVGGRLAASATTSAVAFASMAASGSSAAIGLRMMATTSPLAAAGLTSVAVAGRAASVALAFFGGPIGLAVTALAGGMYYLSQRTDDASESAKIYEDVMSRINAETKTANDQSVDRRKNLEDETRALIATTRGEIGLLQARLALEKQALSASQSMAGADSAFAQGLDIIGDRIAETESEIEGFVYKLSDLEAGLNRLNDTPIDIGGGSSGGSSGAVSVLTETSSKIQDVIDALEFERQQLGRTDREQAVYNALKQAGITAANDNADAVRRAASEYFDLEKIIKEADKAEKDRLETQKSQQDARLEIFEIVDGLEKEREQVGMLAKEVEKLEAIRKAENIATKAGISLSDATRQKIEQEIEAKSRLQQLNASMQQFSAEGPGQIATLASDLQAANLAFQMGFISAEAYVNKIAELNVQAANLRMQMGEGGFTDVMTSALGDVVASYDGALQGISDSFGSFFTTFTDGFANSIGRAIVYSEDLGSALHEVARSALSELISSLVKVGIQYVLNAALAQSAGAATMATTAAMASSAAVAWAPAAALASLATLGANAAPASAGLVSTFGLSQGLAMASFAGFKDGGYTGGGGTSDVAGVVHGQEFVMNADATRKNRGMLETMNAGGNVTTSSTPNVTVHQYPGTEVETQVTENDVVVIARRVSKQVVQEDAPQVIAADLQNPNSRTSRSIGRNTNAQRNR